MPEAITREEVRRLVEEDVAQLVEVLPREQYVWGHLPGAIHLPLDRLNAEQAGLVLGARRPVVVYCNNLQ